MDENSETIPLDDAIDNGICNGDIAVLDALERGDTTGDDGNDEDDDAIDIGIGVPAALTTGPLAKPPVYRFIEYQK
jgi:hypothetical protein